MAKIKKKNKIGRPPFEVTPDVLEKVESLAARGLTKEQVANCLGITYKTLNEKQKYFSDFSDAIKRGADKGISIVANALFENAKKGNVPSSIFYLKARANWKDNYQEELSDNIKFKLDEVKALINKNKGK